MLINALATMVDKSDNILYVLSPRSGIPQWLRCEGATQRERKSSAPGAPLCWRGCAPRPRRRAQRGEEAWGQGETRSGAPTKNSFLVLIPNNAILDLHSVEIYFP
jgi:hypothetical protein